jgi:Nucleotidyltransferase of unknown function (DUF6036)
MATRAPDLWSLVLDQQYIDPTELAEAIEDQVVRDDLDFRSRLLIRDAIDALRHHWGQHRVASWLKACPAGRKIEAIGREDLGRPGFPFLASQLMEPTKPETVREFLRELSLTVHEPLRMCVGGSIALIMPGYLSRRTQDLDVVDEVPQALRSQHQLLHRLQQRYRLELAHFQSHYLPMGWEGRLHFLDFFGRVSVYLVDVYDVFLSKLYSIREKDRDDLRAVAPQLDKDTLVRKLKETTGSMLASAELRQRAEQNWYILYGESLPS